MFLIDYIIIFVVFFSVLFGLLRGFLQEFFTSVFWLFNFCFFDQYYYFDDFYTNALQSTFFKQKFLILVVFLFFYKRIFKYFSKKIIKKMNFFGLNIFLGGVFGTLRGVILVFLFLIVFKSFSIISYNNYVQNSILIAFFFKKINYSVFFFDNFLEN